MKASRCRPSRPSSPGASTREWIMWARWRRFEREFNEDLAVIAFAVKQYGLPPTLKLSVHSGSDKFSLYGPIRRGLRAVQCRRASQDGGHDVAGRGHRPGRGRRQGLALAKEIYAEALEQVEELCAPYAAVIDIDRQQTARGQRGSGLERGAVRGGAAARPDATRPSTRTCGSCCTWAIRLPPRWARAIWRRWKPAKPPCHAM